MLRLGLRKLAPQEWLVVDDDFEQFFHNKQQSRERYGEKVYQALPGSEAAQLELQNLVMAHLINDHSNTYEFSRESITHRSCDLRWRVDDESLWHTSLWIQEDICLMELHGDDYRLTAASVCAPSNWALEEKIGRSLDEIHHPVPGYAQQLSGRVNRLFTSLKPDKPLLRFNWSVQKSSELFWRSDLLQQSVDTEAPGELYWRVERQTLRRLPETGAIVFSIRIFIHSFSDLDLYRGVPADWRSMIRRLPGDQKEYKGLNTVDL